jgi:hypothetical protein
MAFGKFDTKDDSVICTKSCHMVKLPLNNDLVIYFKSCHVVNSPLNIEFVILPNQSILPTPRFGNLHQIMSFGKFATQN